MALMQQGRARRWLRYAAYGLAGLVAGSIFWVLLYAVLPVPATPLMLIRAVESGQGWQKHWQPLDRLSPHLPAAVIAAEDSRFCQHGGVDWDAVEQALERNEGGGTVRGGSTISQQVAKNAFLWPDRSWLRKGVELWFTGLVETVWSKRRIMEVYLNIVEWAPGVYGADAAARHWFGKAAADLTAREAALLAAILPSPLKWKANPPGRYVAARAGILQRRMEIVRRDGLDDCVGR
jgi:monofunctional biosynthetic peptidoglycan transglycosylase